MDDGLKEIREARAAENWTGLLAAAGKVVDVNYADGETHLQSAAANAVLAKFDDAKREKAIAVAIFKSMMLNSDGKSREQAASPFTSRSTALWPAEARMLSRR